MGKFQPQERAKALANGEVRYFTGRPCKNGHIEERFAKSGECIVCAALRCKRFQENNKEKHVEYWAKSYSKHAKKKRAYAKAYRESNVEKIKEASKSYKQKNRPKLSRLQIEREQKIKQACPSWVTKEDKKWMDEIYKASKQIKDQYGVDTAVDHIIPIKGKTVCGLHVPWNLRVVTRSYNSQKLNNMEEHSPIYQSKNTVMIHSSALPWNLRS